MNRVVSMRRDFLPEAIGTCQNLFPFDASGMSAVRCLLKELNTGYRDAGYCDPDSVLQEFFWHSDGRSAAREAMIASSSNGVWEAAARRVPQTQFSLALGTVPISFDFCKVTIAARRQEELHGYPNQLPASY
jgi:hypothetical protein